MAILDKFEVVVKVEGLEPQEFASDDEKEPETSTSTTKYIEAVSRARFSVQLAVKPGYRFTSQNLSFEIYMNGKFIDIYAFRKNSYKKHRAVSWTQDRTRTGSSKSGKWLEYRFADLETRDPLPGETAEQVAAKYAGLGTLVVKVWRATDGVIVPAEDLCNPLEEEEEVVPAKALKGRAVTVSTSLEPIEPAGPLHKVSQLSYHDEEPVATFTFKYRTKRDLQTERIIPSSIEPIALEDKSVANMTEDEMRELIRRQKIQLMIVKREEEATQPATIKRAREATISRTERPAKRARGPLSRLSTQGISSSSDTSSDKRRWTGEEIEVIDLID